MSSIELPYIPSFFLLNLMPSTARRIRAWHSQVGIALKSSWITLFIVAIVLLLTNLDQSDTIVVDLLDRNPANLVLFIALLLFLTQIVSHYPVYLEIKQTRTGRSAVEWNIEPILLGFGFVTYKERVPWKSKIIGHLRNLWGLLLLVAVFYLLLVVHSRSIEVYLYEESAVQRWRTIQVVLYALLGGLSYWLTGRYFTRQYRAYRKLLINTNLVIFLLVLAITLFFSATQGWSRPTYWWVYTLLCVATPCYSVLRLFRSNTWLSKDLIFLKFIAASGFLSIGVLVLAHRYVFMFNPLVILLAQLILLYGMVIIPIKHYFYYRQPGVVSGLSLGRRLFFVWILPAYIPLLFIWSCVIGRIGNDLHLLPVVDEKQMENTEAAKQVLEFEEFVRDFDRKFTRQDTVYFIASFGGGLKANIWNQLILDSLRNYRGHDILSHTVAISGVSGGAIGHAVFGGLLNKSAESHKAEIEKLGRRNFVSLDLAYLLGRDLFFELLPDWVLHLCGLPLDRAKRAMAEYDKFVQGDSTMLTTSFRSFWGTLYRKEKKAGRFFPAMIANAAGTHIQRGVACSVKMSTNQFESTFFDSTDLLSFSGDSTSLPYLYAVSCANRFPIFSPAAKVSEKGHFIDGGYFENSGMLSLQDFYTRFRRESCLFKDTIENRTPTVVFIQIINSKEDYLKSLLKGQQLGKEVKESSELSSILGTVTSISFVPSFLMKKNADTSNYVQIHLPYYVTDKDIKSLFKADSVGLNHVSKQNKKQSNDRITAMQDSNWYQFVQPPLARLLGKQAVNYMEASLRQDTTWADLNRLIRK
jgi:hypothetical protein